MISCAHVTARSRFLTRSHLQEENLVDPLLCGPQAELTVDVRV